MDDMNDMNNMDNMDNMEEKTIYMDSRIGNLSAMIDDLSNPGMAVQSYFRDDRGILSFVLKISDNRGTENLGILFDVFPNEDGTFYFSPSDDDENEDYKEIVSIEEFLWDYYHKSLTEKEIFELFLTISQKLRNVAKESNEKKSD